MELMINLLKMGILYFVIVISYYLIGKKNINELSITDFLIFLVLSNYIILSITLLDQSFLYTMINLFFIITLQIVMTYISSFIPTIKYMYKDKSSFLIKKGKLKFKDLIKKKQEINDLLDQLNYSRLEDVEYGVLENNGRLSKTLIRKNELPLPVIIEGQIQHLNLKILNKNEKWLNNICLKENVSIDNIFYAFYKANKIYIIKNNN